MKTYWAVIQIQVSLIVSLWTPRNLWLSKNFGLNTSSCMSWGFYMISRGWKWKHSYEALEFPRFGFMWATSPFVWFQDMRFIKLSMATDAGVCHERFQQLRGRKSCWAQEWVSLSECKVKVEVSGMWQFQFPHRLHINALTRLHLFSDKMRLK